MGIFSSITKVVRRKPTPSSEVFPDEKSRTYIQEVVKNAIKDTIPYVERTGDIATISYLPRNSVAWHNKNSLVAGITRRSKETKYSLISDYDLARVERFYEKEGILRRYVVTATARAMRAEFSLTPNFSYQGPKRDSERLMLEIQKVLKKSSITWNSLIQTILKEIHIYGNSIIRKYRVNKKIDRLLHDDPLFYKVVIDSETLLPESYIREPRTRPRAWSEDTYSANKLHFGVYPQFMQSDYLGRRTHTDIGYYGSLFTGTGTKAETIPASDICHIKYMVEKNAPFSMPPAMPVLNDIEDMRILEENLVYLGWQFGHPILVATVDCTNLTRDEAETEIARVRDAIDNMESNGYIVATNRLKIELKYPNGSGVPIDAFINHFSRRISKNMDTAALLMGDGGEAGRQAGEAIEASSNDIIWMTCNIVAEKLQEEIIRELWKNISSEEVPELPVKIRLVEIDRKRFTAYVNQLTNFVNTYIIPGSRLLDRIGEKPLTEAEKREIIEFSRLRGSKAETETSNPVNQYGEQSPGSILN